MGDASQRNARFGGTGVIELTGKIMMMALVLLFFVVVFVFCLHLYAKCFWHRRQENHTITTTRRLRRRRRRLDFVAGHQEISVVSTFRGLDPSVLKTIPVLAFDPKAFKDALDCAVCLCDVSEGEKARLLPKCNHGFHVDCIDMWFQSHSTCPLCRNPVSVQNQSNTAPDTPLETALPAPMADNSISDINVITIEAANFPTNVLIWGNETQVSTFGHCGEESHQGNTIAEPSSSSSSSSMALTNTRQDGVSVIDIPRQINEEDDQKSPLPTRLRSLKRFLSGNRRVNPSSPRNLDLEQGGRGQG